MPNGGGGGIRGGREGTPVLARGLPMFWLGEGEGGYSCSGLEYLLHPPHLRGQTENITFPILRMQGVQITIEPKHTERSGGKNADIVPVQLLFKPYEAFRIVSEISDQFLKRY